MTMKSVMISIQPKWCELIARGQKTIEVRKTKPKLDTPLKVYIYCTKDKHGWFDFGKKERLDGKVIGEFVCDRIYQYASDLFRSAPVDGTDISTGEMVELSCLSAQALYKYEHSTEPKENCICLVGVYGWHISDLIIYDKPRELREFVVEGDCDCMNCRKCIWADPGNGYNVEDDCNLPYEYMGKGISLKPLFRPPQSWCYVEELPYA